MRAVMLAGGKGTRLAPYTTVLPKPLLPIGEVPVAEILIRQLVAAGVDHITMAVGHLAGLLQAYFGDGERFSVRIDYSLEDDPRGTAGPLTLIEGLDQPFFVVNGDLLTTLDFSAMAEHHSRREAIVTVGMTQQQHQIELGVLETNGEDVTAYIEKPPHTYDASVGAYVMEPEVLRFIPRDRPYDLPELIVQLIGAGQPVKAFRFDGHWIDIGRPYEYAQATELFEHERERFLPRSR
jgi:NDP-sugar pyrophosphorylase family protein